MNIYGNFGLINFTQEQPKYIKKITVGNHVLVPVPLRSLFIISKFLSHCPEWGYTPSEAAQGYGVRERPTPSYLSFGFLLKVLEP